MMHAHLDGNASEMQTQYMMTVMCTLINQGKGVK